MNCVISAKNVSELEELVHLAESLGAWISFEPLHESQGIDGDIWEEIGIRDRPSYERAVEGLMGLKRKGAPIINSLTYLKMIKSRKPQFKCHTSEIILHISSSGTIENCRVHQEPLGMVSDGLSRVWESTREKRKGISQSCQGCLFFGYVENSLLYEFVPEVMAHYEWM